MLVSSGFSMEICVCIWCIWHHCSGPEPIPAEIKAKPHFAIPPLTPPGVAGRKRDILGTFVPILGATTAAACVPGKGISELGSQESSWDGLFSLHNSIMPLLKTHSGIVLLLSPHSVELQSASFSMPVILGNFQEVLPVLWPCRGFPNEALTDLRSLLCTVPLSTPRNAQQGQFLRSQLLWFMLNFFSFPTFRVRKK